MWRRAYFLLALLRLYIALCPSYLHPDENFQGPEVVAGRIFRYPVHETWEFTSDNPIRSAFTLWPAYGLPMVVLRWLWEGSGNGLVRPSVVFWTLRLIMFTLSFVLEDWAVHELVENPRDRRLAILMVASSYVTWSWQTHTFSNAIETLVVLWSLVLIRRISREKRILRIGIFGPCVLGMLLVYGTFNRITFPAYLAVPGMQLLWQCRRRRSTLIILALSGLFTTALAIFVDTVFYRSSDTPIMELLRNPVITPLNSLLYNTKPENLAIHGTHPFYQHIAINLPQLLGPAFPLLFFCARRTIKIASAVSGIALLSFFSHQEARFLLPAVPLILSSVNLPKKIHRYFVPVWIVFNVLLGTLMGIFHQGGIYPTQMWMEKQDGISEAFWWKTYSPPTWLLNGRNEHLVTNDLMGLNRVDLISKLCGTPSSSNGLRVLVAPRSATFLDQFVSNETGSRGAEMRLTELWSYGNHVHLDDMDFGDDGIIPTLGRVIGRRGLSVWTVECSH